MNQQAGLAPLSEELVENLQSSPFVRWLLEHNHGDLLVELDEAVRDLVVTVQTLGKKGKFTLEFAVEPKGRTVVVSDPNIAAGWGLIGRIDATSAPLPGTMRSDQATQDQEEEHLTGERYRDVVRCW